MGLKDEINKAILAHGTWKRRLLEYINGMTVDFDIDKAGTDNNCDFGKWLYGDTITEKDKQSEYYSKVKELHTEFHRIVKQVAVLVLAGKDDEAKKMINFNGDYTSISTRLILTLTEWDKSII